MRAHTRGPALQHCTIGGPSLSSQSVHETPRSVQAMWLVQLQADAQHPVRALIPSRNRLGHCLARLLSCRRAPRFYIPALSAQRAMVISLTLPPGKGCGRGCVRPLRFAPSLITLPSATLELASSHGVIIIPFPVPIALKPPGHGQASPPGAV